MSERTPYAVSTQPLVILHGDEMAQVAFDALIERFVTARISTPLIEHDLSALNRMRTRGAVVAEAIADIKRHKTGIKNAGITVNAEQKKAFAAQLLQNEKLTLDLDTLPPAAVKSPNGMIRKQIGGNISREDIPFKHLSKRTPKWKGSDLIAVTTPDGGAKDAVSMAAPTAGALGLYFTPSSGGNAVELHTRPVIAGDPLMLCTVDATALEGWARELFQRGLDDKKHMYVGLKDTVLPGYDGVMRTIIDRVYTESFAAAYTAAGLEYHYGLIDAQAASVLTRPPENAVWAMPDNATGDVFIALTDALKTCGFPSQGQSLSVSRMSAGGGDQYGSFQTPAPADGVMTVMLDNAELCRANVRAGDPVMLMSNERGAIRVFALNAMAEAAEKDEELFFGLDESIPYDAIFAETVRAAASERELAGQKNPTIAILPSADMLKTMFCAPPMKGRYACRNLEGDIVSDVTAAYGGSLATASSAIIGDDGICLFEAPHGTAPDLYQTYVNSDGKTALFNPSALIFALAETLKIRARMDNNDALYRYGAALTDALIATVDSGTVTADIGGALADGVKEHITDLPGFLDAVEQQLDVRLQREAA